MVGALLILHTAVNAWPLIIPVMGIPDGSKLRPFQLVVSILVPVAAVLLFSASKCDARQPVMHLGAWLL